MYNWQYNEWPNFRYSVENIRTKAVFFAEELGLVNGLIMALNETEIQETLIEIQIAEAIKTSEIEGEYMSRADVMSSIKRNLGLKGTSVVHDKRVAGIAKLMTVVRESYKEDLSLEMILEWHKILMESFAQIRAGRWRQGEEPMQVVSGAYGKEIVHFQAPDSSKIPMEMKQFVDWFNSGELGTKDRFSASLVKSAITHLYFESIHPFEDGNGRIGRALAEYALSYTLGSPVLLSISKVIERNKNEYYDALKMAQSALEVTEWVEYFANIILQAQIEAKKMVEFTVMKAKFYDYFQNRLNERQLKAMNKMFETGIEGFKGGMTAKKYIAITKTSKATATRDLQHLTEIGALQIIGAGRSVHYELVL
ncbi:Fic family protein [Pedobacter sp. UBA4863]|uniref:Fic family protein n=1 Tax=Pedobacter sp. UBA4863 TaxID=1947060 RepID=UPI0025F7536B|nr:Fic family protein [Pedobacter sp. UBA4863]